MATYNLTAPEKEIITTWLFGPGGYLDVAVNDLGVSARQARGTDTTFNVLTWIRTNARGAFTDPDDWSQTGMVWWIRISDGVNINPPNRPPERIPWRAYLTLWDTSLIQHPGDTTPVPMYDEAGVLSFMPANANRVQQRNLISKVLGVM